MWSILWSNYPQNNILLVTFPLPKKLPPFTLLVLLSFHILINDSQNLSVHVQAKKKQNPQFCLYWILVKIHRCTR